ncbi:DUF3489 domain-containing protein [Roseitranquillus sediminis]|uniref:DUF3489 domain-containing protein n=1 Tax=Roseitranquillus sediminis TaxID=2809051 RepID=UPI001D0C41CC|nr:DUF3489 domain-containing protein [Roseitranquillus sediminis]MBM9592946.1 DUF3489 domain-containing protein [Roseitranquillus sediminis]
MTKLSDTQLLILSAAAQRDDRNVLPLPGSLRGGAATKVVGALLSRGLIAETATDSQTKADAALNRIWRNDEDGRAILLHISEAGLAAIGVEPEGAPDGGDTAPGGATEAPTTDPATEAAGDAASSPKARKPREGTKQAQLIAMLRTPEGATIDEIVAATGWQPHTVRGAFAGALKKKLGLEVTSDKVEGRGRVYRLEA